MTLASVRLKSAKRQTLPQYPEEEELEEVPTPYTTTRPEV